MKKTIVRLLFFPFVFAVSCQPVADTHSMQIQIDSLKQQLHNTYKPGFGEFMSSIQVHHAKLWFAGKSNNWKLADFEINEIKEALEGLETYCTDRPELKDLSMINQPLDSLANSIKSQNSERFNASFISLTRTCNNCHQITKHEFNVIKIPETPPFSNQVFKTQ